MATIFKPRKARLVPFKRSSENQDATMPGFPLLQINFCVNRSPDELAFSFTVNASNQLDLAALLLPAPLSPSAASRRDELWQHTCFEIFFAVRGQTSYIEVNLAPSGDWNIYKFDSYRQGMRPVSGMIAPLCELHKGDSGQTLQLQSSIQPTGELIDLFQAKSWDLGAAAVLELEARHNPGGHRGPLSKPGPNQRQSTGAVAREYWALAHVGERPDFHLRESFCLQL